MRLPNPGRPGRSRSKRAARRVMVSATLAVATLAFAAGAVHPTISGRAAGGAPAALRALRYLETQVGADGSIAGTAGATEDSVIGFADSGYDPATLRRASGPSALDYLAAQTTAMRTTATAGATAKLILAVEAAHLDPTSFGGHNLRTILAGYYDPASGAYASAAAAESPNTFSESLAVLADATGGQAVPGAALDLLACARRADGSFGYAVTLSRLASPACADSSGDTNDTAIAMQALAAGGRGIDASTLTALHGAQQPDGGFGFDAAGPSDPDSDATVIQGIAAAGQDAASATWAARGGGTAVSNLATFQAAASGGFIFPGQSAADAFTTAEVPAALAGVPYGAVTRFAPGSSPSATPTPTGTPTASASPTPAASPVATATAVATATPTGAAAGLVSAPNTGAGVPAAAAPPPWPVIAALLAGLAVAARSARRRTERRGR